MITGRFTTARRLRRRSGVAFAVALAAGLLAGAAPPASAAPVTCPSTFQVLHDDSIGRLHLPAGPYTITLLDGARLSCADASDLLRQFLQDWDGNLPGRWVIGRSATFTDGPGSATGFRLARAAGPSGGGGGKYPSTGRSCPDPFEVEHDDFIGDFSIPAGDYRITLLSARRMSCRRAERKFVRFLQDFDGRLPGRWILDPETGTFMHGRRNVGFRIEPWSGTVPNGGNSYSARSCGGTFHVLHNDRVGRLRLPRGRYELRLRRGAHISCARASKLFARFLDSPSGRLPDRWRVHPRTGTFRRGHNAFSVKRDW